MNGITSIKKISFHLLFWLIFFAGWYLIRYQDFSTKQLAAKLTAIKVIDLAIMVYASNYLLVPGLLYKKRYILFGLCYVALVFCFSMLKMRIEGMVMHNPNIFRYNFRGRVYDNIIPHFLLVSTGVAFKLILDHAKAQKRIHDIAQEKKEAELNFLRAQMNPHFLFNALNSIYFLIDKSNSGARNALHTFSEMLCYQLYEANSSKINIEEELNFLKKYVAVQKLRKNQNFYMEFDTDIQHEKIFIEPLLLIPFVENAFKHLSHYRNGKKDTILITLKDKGNELYFSVANTTDDSKTTYVNDTHGVGLRNVERRLELLYHGKYSLSIDKGKGWYKVCLSIRTNNL